MYLKEFDQQVSEKELTQVIPKDKKALFVVNKIDLAKEEDSLNFPDLPEPFQNIPKIGISALKNLGIDELRKMVINMSIKDLDVSSNSIIPNIRHKETLKEAVFNLESAEKGLLNGHNEETLAFDIRNCINALGKITGETAEIDILDNIFRNFCIGK